MLGLPEVPSNATQVMESSVASQPTLEPLSAVQATAPSLPPVVVAPPRTKTGGVLTAATLSDAPRSKSSGGTIPRAIDAPRRPSRIAVRAQPDEPSTDPTGRVPVAAAEREKFEWTMPRVAGLSVVVAVALVSAWVFWPSSRPKRPARPVAEAEPIAVEEPIVPQTATKPVAVAPIVAAAPSKPTFKLDAKKHVIDPFGAHLEDLELDPAHRYRLHIERDDGRLGTVLARLDEKGGWGVMRKMASHAVLQFGGAKALRMHCEPGSHFSEGQTFPLELLDLATKKKIPVAVNPALHCWDFEMARTMDLGESVKKRIRVPTDSSVKVGDKVPLRVAWVLEALGEKKQWRTGVLTPGESLLAEGRSVRFAILDPYAGDNDGTLDLEILSGDTENAGLVTPSNAAGAQFVPVSPK